MTSIPTVTVLMSTFNDARFLPAAVESILAQSFTDFEFLIIDDGSADCSPAYLRALGDPRVRVLTNAANFGLSRSLNRGLDAARGKYVARMDADDIALPDRLTRQVAFLEGHVDIGILGSSRLLIDEAGADITIAHAAPDDLAIRWKCLLGNPFAHPTVMLRRSVLESHMLRYVEVYRAEDYALWPRVLRHTRGANLPEPLLKYRLRERNDARSMAEQLANHDRIAHAACRELLATFPLSLDEVTQLRGRYGGFSVRDQQMDPAEPNWVHKRLAMLDAFASTNAESAGITRFVADQRAHITNEAHRRAA